MILCKKCGNQNPLGRVFCTKCGTKLDLTHMTADHVVEIKKKWSDPIVQHWQKLAWAVGIIILLLAGLAFWPQLGLIGKEGTRVNGRKVDLGLVRMRGVRPGEALTMTFTEEDINGYFKFFKSKLPAESVRVSIMQGYFRVRVIKPLGSIPIPQYRLNLKLSYDLDLVPYGGRVIPKRVFMGHLSLVGPLRTSIVRKVIGMFARENEWSSLKNISDVKAETGKLVLQAKK